MSLLRDFETRLERLVEGVFTKGFKSALQPIELAKLLAREMDKSRTLGVSKVLVPNQYTIYLSPADNQEFDSFKPQLVEELKGFLNKQMKSRHYSTLGDVKIFFEEKESLSVGQAEINSKLATPTAGGAKDDEILASLNLAVSDESETFFLTRARMTLGRLENNDIVIPDPSISRHHAEIANIKGRFNITDLNSTNGTFINNRKIAEGPLKDGDKVGLGNVKLIFRRLD